MTDDGIKKILLAGEGGQGVQVIAEILTLAAKDQNDETSYIPNFGVEQRNGVSMAFVQISKDEVSYPKFSTADIVVAMCDRSVEAIETFADNNTLVIFDGSNIKEDLLKPLADKYPKSINLQAKKIANEQLSPKAANVIFLGVVAANIADLDREVIRRIMNEKFKKYTDKNPELGKMNNAAYDLGLELGSKSESGDFEGSELEETQRIFEDETRVWERFPELCKSCGMCIAKCPKKAISWSKDLNERGTPLPKVDIDNCTSCASCQKVCPDGALCVKKK